MAEGRRGALQVYGEEAARKETRRIGSSRVKVSDAVLGIV
jgi:hypothetical protein